MSFLFVWLIALSSLPAIAGVAGCGNPESVAVQPRNVRFFCTHKLLILGTPTFGQSAPRSQSPVALGNGGLQAFPVEFDGSSDRHGEVVCKVRRDLRFQPLHLPQLALVGAFCFSGSAGIGIEFNPPFKSGHALAELFQGIGLDIGRDVLELLKFGEREPSLSRILGLCASSAPLKDAINNRCQIGQGPSFNHGLMVHHEGFGNLTRGSFRHRLYRVGDDSFQVAVHKCVKYAPDWDLAQELRRTTTGRTTLSTDADSTTEVYP